MHWLLLRPKGISTPVLVELFLEQTFKDGCPGIAIAK
jgi:hypothetical protein